MKSSFLRMLLTAVAVGLALGLIVAVLGALIAGWNRPADFSNALFITGAIVVVLGLLSIFGGLTGRANSEQQFAQSAGDMNLQARTQRMLEDVTQGHGIFIFLLVAGVVLLIMALLSGL